MYFKRLELIGFKSFCDKTTLDFEPGVSAIVGPNGCGKSNCVDAMRWVLGEQSAKSLRGSEMLDVIFNGTDNKEPLGLAEVTLTFDNKARFFNFEHDEVAITRRLFRSGESEYMLNRTTVRLKDILDLLLGTGIGAESYSIVAQGKIDLVLSSRPEDRRLVFDEASGITKYKSQKREAQRKLEETDLNLARVNDIVTEVKRQISSLERQANKARRYKEVFEELKTNEVRLSGLQKKDLNVTKEALNSELSSLQQRESALMDEVRVQESRINSRQEELKGLQDALMNLKNEILQLENTQLRNDSHISFNKEKIAELESGRSAAQEQIIGAEIKVKSQESKLEHDRLEYAGLEEVIRFKSVLFKQMEEKIQEAAQAVKQSLEIISGSKMRLLELAASISAKNNQITDAGTQEQVFLARKKRLEVERAKCAEEKAVAGELLSKVMQEVEEARASLNGLKEKSSALNADLKNEADSINQVKLEISGLEAKRLALISHKEFLEKLKSKYDDISEKMNATVYLDRLPAESSGGLVIKIKDSLSLSDEDKAYFNSANFKLTGEAKPIELDTVSIEEKLLSLENSLNALKVIENTKTTHIEDLKRDMGVLEQELRSHEINLANKDHARMVVIEQLNRIKEEEDIIVLELTDCNREIEVLEKNILQCRSELEHLNSTQRSCEDAVNTAEEDIRRHNAVKEESLVCLTQVKTELEGLNKRMTSDLASLSALEEDLKLGRQHCNSLKAQFEEAILKIQSMHEQINECVQNNAALKDELSLKHKALSEAQASYERESSGGGGAAQQLQEARRELEGLRERVYELQMKAKDTEYQYAALKERMLNAYKIDLEELTPEDEAADLNVLSAEIVSLKEKLDSYGTVNLVAIEEYDELKVRYDFLIQQQTDLVNAKEQLHQAILKINRTTKQMFMETFEKVRVEFRNYFRMLFNGGDAQVFLIDEQDPLESGIEIICRPPGKKLQNVLLLSGGEKSMSAIALIFAIFKVKPSPFCILDEIDAALDEANVDRFSRMLQEFAKGSQFIVITHNKKTIANADIMYGITMEQSGVSKIVSVKFAKDKTEDGALQPVS